MKNILVTAYAINPYKGSEDGTGWNWVYHMGAHHRVIAITRKNNREAIEKFYQDNHDPKLENIQFEYFDWPRWMIFWKKGPYISMIYFYLWQLTIPLFVLFKGFRFEIAHALNFHSDWVPHFLWVFGKPTIWGPIGHHAPLPEQLIDSAFKGAERKSKIFDLVKKTLWKLDPLLALAQWKSDIILQVNSNTNTGIASPSKLVKMPAVGTSIPNIQPAILNGFELISVGRFVSLKGFDLTIDGFIDFYKKLNPNQRTHTKLRLIGKGPMLQPMQDKIDLEGMHSAIEIIPWIPQQELFTLMSQATAMVFPSHEGAGMVVPEALSYGLPVICLDNDGPGELVPPSTTLKVSSSSRAKTIQEISQNLYRLYTDKPLLEHEKSLAQNHAVKTFSWSAKAEMLSNIYEAFDLSYKSKTLS